MRPFASIRRQRVPSKCTSECDKWRGPSELERSVAASDSSAEPWTRTLWVCSCAHI